MLGITKIFTNGVCKWISFFSHHSLIKWTKMKDNFIAESTQQYNWEVSWIESLSVLNFIDTFCLNEICLSFLDLQS